MIEKSPILITGVPRSGTSMIAATINLCGAFGGEMSKRGMNSNDRIREEIVKPYLIEVGIHKDGLSPRGLKLNPIDIKDWVENIMMEEGYYEGSWMYKDYRLSLMWSIWNQAFPNAKWVIVRRRTGDILQSCMKTGYMTTYSDEKGWLNMVHEYEKKLVSLIESCPNHFIIWPERMVQGDYQQIYDMCDWLGITWNPESLHFINTLLWGSKNKKERSVV